MGLSLLYSRQKKNENHFQSLLRIEPSNFNFVKKKKTIVWPPTLFVPLLNLGFLWF